MWSSGPISQGQFSGKEWREQVMTRQPAEAKRLAYAAWDRIFTLGQAPVEEMRSVSLQIEEAQRGAR